MDVVDLSVSRVAIECAVAGEDGPFLFMGGFVAGVVYGVKWVRIRTVIRGRREVVLGT